MEDKERKIKQIEAREMLDKFAELQAWDKNKLIGWSEAAEFAEWYHQLFTKEETIYEFAYTDCIYESACATMSIHRTRKGAEMALEFHKNERRKEYEKMYKNEKDPDLIFKYDEGVDWIIRETKLKQ